MHAAFAKPLKVKCVLRKLHVEEGRLSLLELAGCRQHEQFKQIIIRGT